MSRHTLGKNRVLGVPVVVVVVIFTIIFVSVQILIATVPEEQKGRYQIMAFTPFSKDRGTRS